MKQIGVLLLAMLLGVVQEGRGERFSLDDVLQNRTLLSVTRGDAGAAFPPDGRFYTRDCSGYSLLIQSVAQAMGREAPRDA